MNEKDRGAFIFQDLHGRRWPRLRRVLVGGGLVVGVAVFWFFNTLFTRPEVKTPASIVPLKRQLKAAINRTEQDDPNAINWQRYYSESKSAQERLDNIRRQARKISGAKGETPAIKGEIRLGYYVEWDPNSLASLEDHASSLTHLAPEWFSLQGTESRLVTEPNPRLISFAAAHNLTLMPLLENLQGDTWQPEAVENLANGTADKRSRFIRELLGQLRKMKAGGLIIDWQQLDPAYRDNYTDFLQQIADTLQGAGMELWFTVSPGEDFKTFHIFGDPDAQPGVNSNRPALETFVNRFVVMLHDENSETDAPGPIASQPWLEGWLKVIVQYADPDQWIAVLGAYAYDWNTTTKKTEMITFKDAMSRASEAGLDVDTSGKKTEVGPPSYNGQYQYAEQKSGEEHTVSFLDAITFYNHLRAARAAEFGGIGIVRLGMEDPQIWDVLELKGQPSSGALKALGTIKASDTITNVGRGEVVTVDATRDDGARIVTLDTSPPPPPANPKDAFESTTLAEVHKGLLRASYTDFAKYPILYHQGAGGEHEVAITFDDGPDPEWTPKILDILREKGVKACFFLLGKNCENYRGLVQRIVAEGHEIGNHTTTHRNLAVMSEWQMELELTITQRLIEDITGRSTTLFRPPYNADSNPTDIAELAPLRLAQEQLGYTVVLEKIDPQDWARPGAEEIVQRVKDLRNEGNIILLHDAGGDRSETVAALPQIIDYLHTRGDRIVSLSTLLGIPRDELMPLVDPSRQPMERFVAQTGFRTWHGIVEFFWAFMVFSTGLVVARTLLVAWLAHRHHRTAVPGARTFEPSLSVVIAAFNEGKVIQKTLHSVLDTDYAGDLEVIVVDDGSRDDTAARVEELAATEPRIRLVRQPNRGKAAALRHGVTQSRHEIVVFLDADTQFQRCTLHALVEPLSHPLVGAVSGHARVGNLRTFIARFQSLEYICGFNLDRRAYTEWHCITVVPGAVSALRRSAIVAAGGFSDDTLAEDTDLTLTLHRLGYRIEYAPGAIAWTEAPESYRGLAKQRFRWAFGTMQCLWKHRDLVFNPRYGALGWFSLPNIWFMQIGLVAVTPLVDWILLCSLVLGHAAGIWYWFALVLGMELFLAALACWMDGEQLFRAFLIVPMRFVYRPLLAWVIWRSIFRAFKGAFVAWGKLGAHRQRAKPGMRALFLALSLAFWLSACDQSDAPKSLSTSPSPAPPPAAVSSSPARPLQQLAIPQHGIYTGAYIDWGDKEDTVTLEGIEGFEHLVGKHQAIVASSSYWGEGTFPEDNLRLITRHGSVPLVFWSPWDKPYIEGRGPDKFSLTSIIAGEHDAYIDMWADKAREFGSPIVVSFANEANGEWFPWSGKLYGGSTPVPGTDPIRFQGPETFKKAYRHVVDRVRAKGAANVQFVLHLMNYSLPQEGWNLATEYYPGPNYVDWLGFSLYGAQFRDDDWTPFFPLLDWPYEEMRRLDATKPVMVCEWSVGEFPDKGSKGDWIRDAFRLFKSPKYPNIKACVYWHERWENENGLYSNLHVNSTPDALEAFRQGIADPAYLSAPIIKPAK